MYNFRVSPPPPREHSALLHLFKKLLIILYKVVKEALCEGHVCSSVRDVVSAPKPLEGYILNLTVTKYFFGQFWFSGILAEMKSAKDVKVGVSHVCLYR
jgi:hypothetical protein